MSTDAEWEAFLASEVVRTALAWGAALEQIGAGDDDGRPIEFLDEELIDAINALEYYRRNEAKEAT